MRSEGTAPGTSACTRVMNWARSPRSKGALRPFVAIASLVAVALASSPAHADVYDDFNAFAKTAFGAEKDPLVYEWFGPALDPPRDWWEHVSESSAAIGFTTNLPALTYIEYGPTTAYGQIAGPADRHYYQHLHHLTGLTPGVTHHYRVVMFDELGSPVFGDDRVVTPMLIPGAIRIPADLTGPPYELDTPNAYYLVTEDIVADGSAFEVLADSIVLDLGGHHVTYNDTFQTVTATEWWEYRNGASYGVRSMGYDELSMYNGFIVQGAGQNGGYLEGSIGFSPIYFWEGSGVEISGMVVEYSASQLVGIFPHWQKGSNEIHHNVLVDRGTEIPGRHGLGSSSIGITGGVVGVEVHHNLVKRTRHNALNGQSIHDNEIYVDSHAINAFGISGSASDREGFGNKIFGTGYHAVGIGWGKDCWWHDNFIHMAGQGPSLRSTEYGNQESLNGFRLTQYTGATVDLSNSLVERNLVLVSGGACDLDGECTQARGLQYSSDPYVVDNIIRDNTIKVVMADGITQAASIVTQGQSSRCGTEAPIEYIGNTLISNIVNVRMGDYAGAGCNHRFTGNELIRVGARPDYRTLAFDFPVATRDHYFYDSIFSGGASYDLAEFTHSGQELTVGWKLTVLVSDGVDPINGASVTVKDIDDVVVASGTTNPSGRFSSAVMDYRETMGGRTYYTPAEILAEHGGVQKTMSVPLGATTTVSLVLDLVTGAPVTADGSLLRFSAVPAVMGHATQFRWSRALDGPATLKIYDVRGRSVRDVALPVGAVGAAWDGRDGTGRRVGSGVYLARLDAGRVSATCRVVVLR